MQAPTDNRRRAYWLKALHKWHWISSALCLVGLVLFAVTGFTLNHASKIEAQPRTVRGAAALSPAARDAIEQAGDRTGRARLPAAAQQWISDRWSLDAAGIDAEWSADEVYVSMPRAGGDAWVRIDRADGRAEFERTDRGWISYLNDLHKGRNTGVAWSWFIDIFAVACLVFSITGLFLLKMHATKRPMTWPVVGLGLVIPLLLAILVIH